MHQLRIVRSQRVHLLLELLVLPLVVFQLSVPLLQLELQGVVVPLLSLYDLLQVGHLFDEQPVVLLLGIQLLPQRQKLKSQRLHVLQGMVVAPGSTIACASPRLSLLWGRQ